VSRATGVSLTPDLDRAPPAQFISWRSVVQVHVLLLRDQYDSALLGVFADRTAGRAAADRRFSALPAAAWQPHPRGGEVRKVGSDGAYLWLGSSEVDQDG
jgi:hypothetical protein